MTMHPETDSALLRINFQAAFRTLIENKRLAIGEAFITILEEEMGQFISHPKYLLP